MAGVKIAVVATAGPRRRAGFAFGPEAVIVDVDELTEDEIDQLKSDPQLAIVGVERGDAEADDKAKADAGNAEADAKTKADADKAEADAKTKADAGNAEADAKTKADAGNAEADAEAKDKPKK